MPPKRMDDHYLKRSRDKTHARGRQESPERDTSQRRNPREPSQRRQRDASPPESSRREAPTRRSNNRREFQVPASPDSPTPTKKSKASSDAASSSRGNGSTTDTSTLRRSSRLASDSDDSMSTSSQSSSRNSGILRDDGPRVPRRDSSRPRNSVRFGDQGSPVQSMNQSDVRDSRSRQVERASMSARCQSTQRNPISGRFERASTAARAHSRRRDSSSSRDQRESTSNNNQSRPREARRDEIASTAPGSRSRSRTSRIDHGKGTSGGPSGSQPTSTRPSRAVSRVQPERRSKSKPKVPEIRRDVSTMESQSTTNRNRSVSPSPSPTSSGGKSIHRSRSQKPKNKKDEVPFAEIIKKVHQNSIDWFVKCCVVSKYKQLDRTVLSAEARRTLDKLKNDVEEPDCFSQKIPMPQRNKATTEDYRMLDQQFNKLVLSVKRTGATQARFDRKLPKGPTFTGDMYLDPTNTSADRVVEAAQEMLETGRHTIYEPLNETRMRNLPFERTGALESDLAFFKKYPSGDNPTKQPKEGHLPVAVYDINKIEETSNLKESLLATSVAVVRNACKVFGLDTEKFKLDAVERINPEVLVEIVRQIPQPTSSNYHARNTTRQTDEEKWVSFLHKHEVKITVLADFYRNVETLSKRTLEKIIDTPSEYQNLLRHLAQDMKTLQIPLPKNLSVDEDAFFTAFGTNVDILNTDDYETLREEIKKMPEFLQPIGKNSFWANIQDQLPGVNAVQIYYKVPGVRTFAHLENGCLASININLGGGECIWYSVPMEYSARLQQLVREKLRFRDDETIFNLGFWPVLQCCLDAGIPIQKFTQKPGDMVVIGPGTYHWVQSNDITTHIAWNTARPTFIQLASIGISHDHYLSNKYTPMIPIESFIWSFAGRSGLRGDFVPLLKHFLCRSLANCQFEFEFIQRKQYTRLNANQKPNLKPVERCQISTCGKCLFNTIPVDRAGNVLCYECLQRKGLLDLKSAIRVYIRFEMTKLKEKYNAVVCHPR